MKRLREQAEDEDRELQLALLASLTGDDVVALERASALNTLYAELREKADRKEWNRQATLNHAHNMKHPTLLTVDLILLRILQCIPLVGIGRLYCTSKNMANLVLSFLERYPVKSLDLGVITPATSKHRLQPFFWNGPLSKCLLVGRVNTLRIRVRLPHSFVHVASPPRHILDGTINRIIVNVLHSHEIAWFKQSFVLKGVEVIIYHEKPPFADPLIRLTYAQCRGGSVDELDAVVDPRGLLFDDIRNFTQLIEPV